MAREISCYIFVLMNLEFFPPANEVWGKVIFLHQFVILFTWGGRAWLLRGGMRGCSRGGMCGCSGGACVVAPGGHVWLLGGRAWLLPGGCVVAPGGACMVFFSFFGYNEIRSMSGRYASYWNAFL